MWTPLLDALDLEEHAYETPALPGFDGPIPEGFTCTKDAYADWLIRRVETIVERIGGPVHLVGHDWGAILSLRIASLRPDLFRTWAVSNALPDPDYVWHTMAQRWQTPIIGELIMALSKPTALANSLEEQGVQTDIARHEAGAFRKPLRPSIQKLYRSAVDVGEEWRGDLDNLPDQGLVFWGETDPYVPLSLAERVCATRDVPLHVEYGAGHWAVVERAEQFAKVLKAHWANTEPTALPSI